MAMGAERDDDLDSTPLLGNKECPFSGFHPSDCILLAKLPAGAITVPASYAPDALMSIVAIRLVDAANLISWGHRDLLVNLMTPSIGAFQQSRQGGDPMSHDSTVLF